MQQSRIIYGLTLVSFLAFLGGCSSTKEKPKEPASATTCVYPNSTVIAPDWVCDVPVKSLVLSAVGIAEPSKAGFSFMKDIAAADGRGRLAEQLQGEVKKMVKQYLGTTGKGDSETVDAAASSTLKTITHQTLVGSRVHQTRTGPNGRLYVLVGIDEAAKTQVVKAAVETSMRNDAALWQQFKAQQSFEEMAAEIAKQPIR